MLQVVLVDRTCVQLVRCQLQGGIDYFVFLFVFVFVFVFVGGQS